MRSSTINDEIISRAYMYACRGVVLIIIVNNSGHDRESNRGVIVSFRNVAHLCVATGHLVPSPILGLACAPIVETRFLVPCLYSIFHLETPLVLSRFCFLTNMDVSERTRSSLSRDPIRNHRIKSRSNRDIKWLIRTVLSERIFISSGSKIVKRLRRRQYDPLIIETTIGLVLCPCTALCRLFLKHCTLTNKAVGTIWRALSKPPQRRHGPDLRPLWLLVGTPSAIRPELAFSRAEHSLPYSDVTIYIFATLYLSSMPYV